MTPDSYEKSAPAGGIINSVIYRFDEEDFPSQPVEIHIDEPLQERLDLASGNIIITGP
ncbi:hypothetical protein [Salibacterium aidingense]|uniref:hypothetical protein n=1 Tax=Salibacterium aidingense TaxID=384933 RepID=UPI0003FD94D1|nr:hypothetical protein [Salibacterium aidingense]